ncbi:hypothetical protein CH252_33315 [Rhodococcus sp. 06-1477-1B]|nr:hypothetical protein CH252_33315 [Rhodococcus sp. 06-1477-1B]OZD46260.1 hypothetical protein CH266_21560 [Rhodococcus sp. 06-1474-1B]
MAVLGLNENAVHTVIATTESDLQAENLVAITCGPVFVTPTKLQQDGRWQNTFSQDSPATS